MNSDSDVKEDHTATATAGKDDANTHDAVHEIQQQIERQIAQAKHYYDETSRRWFNFSIEKENLRYKVEAIGESRYSLVINIFCCQLGIPHHGFFDSAISQQEIVSLL